MFALLLAQVLFFYTDAVPANSGWVSESGISALQADSNTLKLSGTKTATSKWDYAVLTPLSPLQPRATYRLEGWMKVEYLSNPEYPPAFKISAIGKTGWVTDYITFPYAMLAKNTWQKLWAEFTVYDNRINGGFISVDTGGTNQSLTATIYLKAVTLTQLRCAITFPQSAYVPDNKLQDVFWPFKKSDVIGFTPSTVNNYRDYGVTFVSWGGYPQPDASSVAAYCKNIADALKVGTKIGAKIEIRTSFGSFINRYSDAEISEAQTKDLAGQPFIVPDAAGVKTRGYPAYWFSINNPPFRDFLKGNAERAMQCKPHGLMVDDVLGDAHTVLYRDGEYSTNGVTGFRNYMKSNFTSAQLLQNGISNIDMFDIKEYHQIYSGVSKENRPFRKELIDFQLKAAADTFREIKSNALAKLGHRIPVSGNIDPASQDAGRLFMDVDYFSFECSMNAKFGNPNNGISLFSYKMADTLKRPAVVMGSGGDHAFIQDNNLPGMIRCWVAEAYAFGNYFMAPYRLWAYSPSKGSYTYQPRSRAELSPVYKFIKNHAYLFDDYQVVASTALVLGYIGYVQSKENKENIVSLAKNLADQSIPFDIIIAGDNVLGLRLSAPHLTQYDNLIVPDGSILSTEDSAVLQKMKDNGKAIVNNIDKLDKSSQIVIKGVSLIRATLRAKKGDTAKTAVVHLLNGDYNVNTDTCNSKQNFVIIIPKKLLKNSTVQHVKYIRPPSWESRALSVTNEYPDVVLDFSSTVDSIEVTIPLLDVWGILVLS